MQWQQEIKATRAQAFNHSWLDCPPYGLLTFKKLMDGDNCETDFDQIIPWAYLLDWDPYSCIKHNSKRPNYDKTDVQPFFLEVSFVPNGMNNFQISSQ